MAQERRFPCPECGAEFHFKADETRPTAPCLKCGARLVMPHGRFDVTHATEGVSIGGGSLGSREPVFGRETGWSTAEEQSKLNKTHAIEAIRRWEDLVAKGASPEECRTAEKAVFWAIWSDPKKPFDLDGKRYKGISRAKGLSVSVTPAPERKRKPKGGE